MNSDSSTELKKMLLSIVIPTSFIFICWLIFLLELSLNISLTSYGLLPRDFRQWYGIFTFPFLHSDLGHLITNSSSFIVLGALIFYFYNDKALQIFLWSYLLSGFFTWIIGRSNIHIGASAMIYAFASYLFTAGVISKNVRNLAISLIVVFLYGSMVWGVFPQPGHISWEGHLSGAVTGIILSYIYKPKPEQTEPLLKSEFDDDCDCSAGDDIDINYHYTDKSKEK